MSFGKMDLTTVGSAAEVLLEAPANRQYEIKFLSAYKNSTFDLNVSVETSRGYRTVFAETVTGGGTVFTDDAIILNGGDKLISQSSTVGIDINGSYEMRPFL